MVRHADPRIGTELAGYRIESLLGRGGMGVVYLAEQVRLKRKVALKLVAPELAQDDRFREQLLRESELAASLDHPNILPIYDAADQDGLLYIAMRYVEGTDLRQLLASESRLEPARAIAICAQVAEGLDVAHGHGLVHRDVKPANVLIASQAGREHCYLADFGLTRSASAGGLVEQSHFAGSADYVAPEQIEGKPVDGRADQYALACVLSECLTGAPPLRRDSMMATFWAHLDEEPEPASARNPELPKEIDAVLAKGLAKEAEERYASCGELVAEARDALGIERRAPLYRRKEVLLAAGGLLAAAVVPAVLLTRGGEADEKVAFPITADAVVRLDPQTGEPVAAVEESVAAPTFLAAGEGAVWVANVRSATVSQVDPVAYAVTGTVGLESIPTDVAAGEGAAWVTSLGGVLTKIDAQTLAKRSTELQVSQPEAVDVGFGSVWVAVRDPAGYRVLRVDPTSAEVIATIPIPRRPSGIAAREGGVWVASRGESAAVGPPGAVLRIDPASDTVVAEIATTADNIAAGEGFVWALGPSIARIDPATNGVAEIAPLDYTIFEHAGIAVGEGAVWATDHEGGRIYRVDPASGAVEQFRPGAAVPDVAVGFGGVWIVTIRTEPA